MFSRLWSIVGILGIGSFGIVLEVKNLKTNETNALKIVRKENSR